MPGEHENGNGTSDRRGGLVALLDILRGPLVWAAHFSFAYAYQSTACALVDSTGSSAIADIRVAIWGATAVALAVIATSIVASPQPDISRARDVDERDAAHFHRRVARTLALLSAFGVAAVGVVASFVDPCAPLR